jgi:hypothetical protein
MQNERMEIGRDTKEVGLRVGIEKISIVLLEYLDIR